jgi:hypothetical protein
MKNFIGGLFKSKKFMKQAYWDLLEAGFDDEHILILASRRKKLRRGNKSGSIKSVAISALTGMLIGTGIAALLGYLIGQEIIVVPGFMPDFMPVPFFVFEAYFLFLAQGAVTGAILGVAFRLIFAREKPSITRTGITRGGVILAVDTDGSQKKTVRQVLEQAGAVDLVNLSEKWNLEVWSKFKQLQPPSAI